MRLTAENWPKLYDLCKASFETYGDEGPAIGSKVMTLVAGHGGGPGCIRTFGGPFEEDKFYFYLSRRDEHLGEQKSLVLRSHWWTEFIVIDSATHKVFQFDWLKQ